MTVAALVLASQLPGREAGDNLQKSATTLQKLSKVEQQMTGFMAANGRRPCPADGQYSTSSQYFGAEAANPGTCTGGTPSAPLYRSVSVTKVTQANPAVVTASGHGLSVGNVVSFSGIIGMTALNGNYYIVGTVVDANNFTLTDTHGNSLNTSGYSAYTSGGTVTLAAVSGVIPTKALGLDDSYAFDEWGRRITYIVDARATLKTSCQTLQTPSSIAGALPGTGNIVIESSTGGTVLDNVMAAYVSHGPDGFGAWPEQGSASRMNTGSTDADEMTNAAVGSGFSANFTNVRVQKGATPTFGDLTYYADYQKNTCCTGPFCASNGFVINGMTANLTYQSGMSMATADVNGDGFPDLILGFGNGNIVYVIFGTVFGFPDPLPLNTLNGSNGYALTFGGGEAGNAIATGDVNGDGIQDIVISAQRANTAAFPGYGNWNGEVYAVFGQKCGGTWATPCSAAYAVTTSGIKPGASVINGVNGIAFNSTFTNSLFGWGLGVGDVNNDGISDIVIGEGAATEGGFTNAGSAYVVYGKASPMLPVTTISTANNSTAATVASYAGLIVGQELSSTNITAGTYIAGCGPTTYGAPCTSTSITLSIKANATASGTALNIASTPLSPAFLNGTNGIEYDGTFTNDQFGSLSTAGNGVNNNGPNIVVADLNGDGKNDLIIGSTHAVAYPNWPGSIYVIWGGASLPSTTVSTTSGSAAATVASYAGLIAGQTVTSANIPVGATISACGATVYGAACTQTGITLSANATATASGTALSVTSTPVGSFPSTTVSTTNGSPAATVGSYAGMSVGQTVYSANIPAGTTITACGTTPPGCNSVNLTLSANATATASGTAFSTYGTPGTSPFLNGINGVELDGVTNSDNLGNNIAVGDVNNDGIADLVIGGTGVGGSGKGAVDVVFGTKTASWITSATPTVLNATFLNATNGVQFIGATGTGGFFDLGVGVAVGDVNGDGIPDIVMSGHNVQSGYQWSGVVYVVFGTAAGWPASTSVYNNTAFFNGTSGIELDGPTSTYYDTGWAVGVANLNGDRYGDIIIGASEATPGGLTDASSTYVFYGRKAGLWSKVTPFNLGGL